MGTAFVFPGQGSHTSDMRERVLAARPDLHALATEVAGCDPFERVADSTRYAQPAILCASLAGLAGLDERPDAMAGHSMGELAALVAAGAIEEADGVRLAFARGDAMAAAGEPPRRTGTMMAVLGGDLETIDRIARQCTVVVANDNAPGQVVLSGARGALAVVSDRLRAHGMRTLRLDVAGAFHSPFMAPAVGPFAEALAAVDIRSPGVPVWSCSQARPYRDAADVRDALAAALVRRVRWRETVTAMRASGITRFVEPGPGRVLTGLIRRTVRDAEAIAADAQVAHA